MEVRLEKTLMSLGTNPAGAMRDVYHLFDPNGKISLKPEGAPDSDKKSSGGGGRDRDRGGDRSGDRDRGPRRDRRDQAGA